jgi:hypothetical protein
MLSCSVVFYHVEPPSIDIFLHYHNPHYRLAMIGCSQVP